MRKLVYGIDGEILVDLDFAKYLKSIGFNKPTKYFWQDMDLPFSTRGLKWNKGKRKLNNNRFDDWIYSAPTVDEAIMWMTKNTPTHITSPDFDLFQNYFNQDFQSIEIEQTNTNDTNNPE